MLDRLSAWIKSSDTLSKRLQHNVSHRAKPVLCQAFFLPDPADIFASKFAHIHAQSIGIAGG